MALSTSDQTLLNSFSQTQPGLTKVGQPAATAQLKLGDTLANLSAATVVKATYDFSVVGGAVSVFNLGVTVAAGAIITALWTDAAVALTSGGSATLAIKAGATTLKSATAFDDATYIGVDAQTLAPVKVSVDSELSVTVAGAALTAGQVNVFVQYIK